MAAITFGLLIVIIVEFLIQRPKFDLDSKYLKLIKACKDGKPNNIEEQYRSNLSTSGYIIIGFAGLFGFSKHPDIGDRKVNSLYV